MSKRFFVVEDDHSCETVLRRIIHSVDPEAVIDWEESAEQAIYSLVLREERGIRYDLIIADIFLSGSETGIDLWRQCRRRYPDTPVMLTSGLPVNQFFDKLGRAEISPAYLCKPFFVGECKQMIAGLVAAR